MVIETDPVPFLVWLFGPSGSFPDWLWGAAPLPAWAVWLIRVVAFVIGLLLISFLVFSARCGPAEAARSLARSLKATFADLIYLSPRRTYAMSWLAVMESVRRLVLVAFVVFVVIIMFAGWYLDKGTEDPAELFVSFVMTATSYLVLALAVFLSVFSLPNDITRKTIQTVVTKPARHSEIVLGRMIGFSLIGTVLLAATGLFSYFFVTRSLDHSHQVVVESIEPVETRARIVVQPETVTEKGITTLDNEHRHDVIIRQDGTVYTDQTQGHWHEIEVSEEDGKTVYSVGPPQGMLTAKVPIYGTLTFTDRTGAETNKGVNVGNEWSYRGYFGGGTLESAVWHFDGITDSRFPYGLPLEFTLSVFRTHKGDIVTGVRGALSLINPESGLSVEVQQFEAEEFQPNKLYIAREIRNPDPEGEPYDLFEDFVHDGQLNIRLRTLDAEQYLGAARPDMFLRAQDASFTMNFIKGYIGIWMLMVIITCLGVMFSTFLNAAVALLATVGAVIFGFFHNFIADLAAGTVLGGGPVESFYRLWTQRNLATELQDGLPKTIVETSDMLVQPFLGAVASLVPDFSSYSDVNYVAAGFNIPTDLLLTHLVAGLAYVLPVFVAGFVFLKSREVAG